MSRQQSTPPIAVVTGAGSGVGRATALKFAAEGWRVALTGRRAETLAATVALAPKSQRARLLALPCDLGNAAGLAALAQEVLARFGRIDVLVNAAGQNIPRRSLGELSR